MPDLRIGFLSYATLGQVSLLNGPARGRVRG